ncbi:MAG: carbon-nitrogen hydrolase family protein [Pirellulales bacterium]
MHRLSLLGLGLLLLLAATPAGTLAEERPADTLRMALVNIKSLYSADDPANLQKNLDRHLYFIDKAAAEGAEFIGFPEMSLSGYKCDKSMPFLKLDAPQVRALAAKAAEKQVYVSAGIAEIDEQGKCWDTQFVIGPDGSLLGRHHKIWMTAEKVFQSEPGTEYTVVEVKGIKIGLFICADGSDFLNIQGLADAGARIVYGSHANTTGGTINGWYKFRQRFGGKFDGQLVEADTSNQAGRARVPSGGWCDHLNIYAALHNHAAYYNPQFDPPAGPAPPAGSWASGAWFIGPDGATLAQMPASSDRQDSQEFMLLQDIPLTTP